MVQAIPHWTTIAGRIRAVRDAPGLDGYALVAVEIESIGSDARANLGETIEVAVRREDAPAEGERFQARVRRARRGWFAAPRD